MFTAAEDANTTVTVIRSDGVFEPRGTTTYRSRRVSRRRRVAGVTDWTRKY